jgi:GAF domain-containing protein
VSHDVGVQDGRSELSRALVEFSSRLAADLTVEAVLKDLADFAGRLLPVTAIGILLAEDGDLTVATTKSPEGEQVEELEVTLGEGPCVDAARSGAMTVARDLRGWTDRYPRFAPAALAMGVHCIYALPLTGQGEVFGALDVINRDPIELPAADIDAARMLCDVAVSYILAARLHEETSVLADQLQGALDRRVLIELAKGMLAERHGIPPGDAFDRLRRYARHHNLQAREVARRVVDDGLRI